MPLAEKRFKKSIGYAELFSRVISTAGFLVEFNRKKTDISSEIQKAKQTANQDGLETLRKPFCEINSATGEHEARLAQQIISLSEEYSDLLTSETQPIEPYIEAYVDAHPDDYFR